MRPDSPMQPVGDVLVAYSARQMPTETIARVHRETVEGLALNEVNLNSAFRIVDLLLNISLAKLKELDA